MRLLDLRRELEIPRPPQLSQPLTYSRGNLNWPSSLVQRAAHALGTELAHAIQHLVTLDALSKPATAPARGYGAEHGRLLRPCCFQPEKVFTSARLQFRSAEEPGRRVMQDVVTLDAERLQAFAYLAKPRTRAFAEPVVHAARAVRHRTQLFQGCNGRSAQVNSPVAAGEVIVFVKELPVDVIGQAGMLSDA